MSKENEEDNLEEEALPEGKFHVEQQKEPQIPLQPIIGTGAPFAPIVLGVAKAEKAVPDASLPADDALRVNADFKDFMEAEAAGKRKQDANPLDDPEGDDVEEFGDIDPADQQAILDEIAKKAAAGGGSASSSSTDGGPRKARATSEAAATLDMEAARKRAEDKAKGSKKPDTAGKGSGSSCPDAPACPPGVADTGSLAKPG